MQRKVEDNSEEEGSRDVFIKMNDESLEDISYQPTEIAGWSFGGFLLSLILNIFFIPITLGAPLWGSFFTVQPQEEMLILYWGRLHDVLKKPGIYWFNFIGRTTKVVSVRTQTWDIKKTTVVDAAGNPIIVSGVLTYKIVNSIRAAFDVDNVQDYMQRQAMATLKKVCSRYPYESKDGVSLQTEAAQVGKEMVNLLQKKADICGVHVLSYELADLQYAPEIAQGMLVRQQAQALLDARKVVVKGAVQIVTASVAKLNESGVKLSDQEQSRLVSNLLAVICSDARVQPMFSISNDSSESDTSSEVNQEILRTLHQLNNTMANRQDRKSVV